MAQADFTKGPWHYDRDVGNDGDYIRETDSDACVAMVIDGGHINPKLALPQSEIDANARLIAKAPDLYRMLSAAVDIIAASGGLWLGEDRARALLAEIRGERVSA